MEDRIFLKTLSKKGLEMAVEETKQFDKIVKRVYEVTAKEIYGTSNPKGLAVSTYGSPGRIELIGGDSDADIFLCEEKRTSKTKKFRELFKSNLSLFDFSKVDLTEWGTYNEVETYLKKSLVEGNQVLETRHLIGDEKVIKGLENKKRKYDTIERGLSNIIFNRLYFNQYFRQRVRNGATNIKYCPGGSRDFLFISWHDKLDRDILREEQDISYQPRVKIGIQRLFEKEKITKKQLKEATKAINFSLMFRSNVLRMNKNTKDRGLTFIDNSTLQRLQMIGYPEPKITRKTFEKHRNAIEEISKIVWEETIKKASHEKGKKWEVDFRKSISPKTTKSRRIEINSDDSLVRVGLIWGASESNQKSLVNYLAEKHKDTCDWATIGSIVCSPHCPSKILHHFGTGIAKEEGYGYLLRVIARNKNVLRGTLENIAEDTKLEERYTEVAVASLNGGNKVANNQI